MTTNKCKITIFLSLFWLVPPLSRALPPPSSIQWPPLSIYIQNPSVREPSLLSAEYYLSSLDTTTVDSILSPTEMYDIVKKSALKLEQYEKIYLFYQWYLTDMPVSIIASKQKKAHRPIITVSENTLQEIHLLFESEKELTAKNLIEVSSKYRYTLAEKLNLWIRALHKNISDQELLKALEMWNITKNQAIYIKDYKAHLDSFIKVHSLSGQEKKDFLRSFRSFKDPVTSLLHEVIKANRIKLFKAMIEEASTGINIPDYLGQTVLHIATSLPGIKNEHYTHLLLKHTEIDINYKDFQGWTPLFHAVVSSENHFFPIVKSILKQPKIKVDIMDNYRRTLPLLAVELEKPNIAQFLHEHGAPLPTQFSLKNSYMDSNHNLITVDYKGELNLKFLSTPLNWAYNRVTYDDFRDMDFNTMDLSSEEMWENFRYYFLFLLIESLLKWEENIRYHRIMDLLINDEYKKSWLSQAIKAIYTGDTVMLKKLFSKKEPSQLEEPLFRIQYVILNPWKWQALMDFHLLKGVRMPYSESQKIIHISHGFFLDEAIRSRQINSVQFFLNQGVDPTNVRGNIALPNSIITALLLANTVYIDEKSYKDYLPILNLLMSHPSVNFDFLNRELFPGITYPDLAGLMGHLPALKIMAKKEAYIKNKDIYDLDILVTDALALMGLLRTKEFVLKELNKQNPEDEFLQEDLITCQRAFH